MVIGRRDAVFLPWPIHTIDFEASSLDDGTYPIEVGIGRWVAPTSDIETWSTLIRPLANWERYGSWSPKAEWSTASHVSNWVKAPDPMK